MAPDSHWPPPVNALGMIGQNEAVSELVRQMNYSRARSRRFSDKLLVGPQTMHSINDRRQTLKRGVEAAELAAAAQRAVGAGIAQGWVDASLPRPSIPDLPDVHDTVKADEARSVYRTPLAQALSFRQAVLEDSRLWLLT